MLITIAPIRVTSILEAAGGVLSDFFPGASHTLVNELFADTEKLFVGAHPDYLANDLLYHDFDHTLQVTLAYIHLFSARQKTATSFTARQFELGLAAALLHDSGYLKLRSDQSGTGAKYTFCHVLRSCAFAASYLPQRGFKTGEIDIVLGAIRYTGPSSSGMKLGFNSQEDHLLACMVATADYLGQMAAHDYPDELDLLFNEFAESDAFLCLPSSQRVFKSRDHLVSGSTAFWKKVVKPKLDNDFLSVYKFLNQPDGSNPYIDKIEHNLAVIARRWESTLS